MNRMNSVETGARIAALRKERSMTQRDLAQLVGVSDKAVSKWERGECFPDVTLFPRLAALFEVDLEELMGQGDAGEIPDSARGGQTKTALLLKNSFCDRQLSGNLKTLLLPFLTVFCGGFLGGSYAALLTGVCFLLQLMWTLWFLGRQRREAQYLREIRAIVCGAGSLALRRGPGRCRPGPVRRVYFSLCPGERQRVWRGGHVAAVHGLFCADRCAARSGVAGAVLQKGCVSKREHVRSCML